MPNITAPDQRDIRIGATITALREAHGLKITELARAIGISRQLMGLIESGDRHADMGKLRRIAGVLGVRLAAITIEDYDQIADEAAS